MNEDDPVETFPASYRNHLESLADEGHKGHATSGMRLEDFIGTCAEDFDDEFMESLREIRRGIGRTQSHS
jgi:hypothetical protein